MGWHQENRTFDCRGLLFRPGTLVSLSSLQAQSVPELKLTRDLRIDAAENELTPISFMGVAPNDTIAFQQKPGRDGPILRCAGRVTGNIREEGAGSR